MQKAKRRGAFRLPSSNGDPCSGAFAPHCALGAPLPTLENRKDSPKHREGSIPSRYPQTSYQDETLSSCPMKLPLSMGRHFLYSLVIGLLYAIPIPTEHKEIAADPSIRINYCYMANSILAVLGGFLGEATMAIDIGSVQQTNAALIKVRNTMLRIKKEYPKACFLEACYMVRNFRAEPEVARFLSRHFNLC